MRSVPRKTSLFPYGKKRGEGRSAHEPKMTVEAAVAEATECALTGMTGPSACEDMKAASWALKAAESRMMAYEARVSEL